jgi:ribosomal protein S18 acetylase RimI-like enzyme
MNAVGDTEPHPMTATAPNDPLVIRRTLRDADAAGIAELHRRVYAPEYGMNDVFVSRVAEGVLDAIAAGWPQTGGGVWLIDGDEELDGCLALTDEGERLARLRWFVLAPTLRGRGLGRSLVRHLLSCAREQGFDRIELETFSALTSAARIYREAGFEVTWERERTDWGPPITYQHYRLALD